MFFQVTTLFALVAFVAAISEKECGPNEVWTECTGCELKCGQGEDTPCTANCRPPSCECSPGRGMRRAEDGSCIPASECPESQCKPNEEWSECRGCEGTCAERFVKCTKECKPPGCECIAGAGFVRDAAGNCIKFEDCPK